MQLILPTRTAEHALALCAHRRRNSRCSGLTARDSEFSFTDLGPFAGPYPGSELVPEGRRSPTMAVTINAAPERLWPWLVQMGRDRGCWYSRAPARQCRPPKCRSRPSGAAGPRRRLPARSQPADTAEHGARALRPGRRRHQDREVTARTDTSAASGRCALGAVGDAGVPSRGDLRMPLPDVRYPYWQAAGGAQRAARLPQGH